MVGHLAALFDLKGQEEKNLFLTTKTNKNKSYQKF